MDEKTEQDLKLIECSKESRVNEVSDKFQSSCQTNPIVRKLLDFSNANKTDKFSIRDLFSRLD